MKTFFLLLVSFLLLACSDEKVAGASTVETENAFFIKVVNEDSTPVKQVVARIRPLWFVHDLDSSNCDSCVQELTTNSEGKIFIDSLRSEKVTLEIFNGNSGLFKQFSKRNVNTSDSIIFSLEKLGSLVGKVNLPPNEEYAWIQIYGTDKLTQTDSNGFFSLDSLPPSNYNVRAIVSENKPIIGECQISIIPNNATNAGTLKVPEIKDENLDHWKFQRNMSLDSLTSDWMEPLSDTTIITVHLDSTNFNFNEAMSNGFDIRFTDTKNQFLPIKISYWDRFLKNAKIYIRLNGLANKDTLSMYWGKSAAQNISDSSIWSNIPNVLTEKINSLEIINFESLKLETAFSYEDGTRNWYFTPQDTGITTTPSAENVIEGFEYNKDRKGTVFHWKNNPKVPGRWSMIGLRLCNVPQNLTSIDSIVFYAKGHGELGFVLEALEEPTGKTKYVNYLDSNWIRFSFTPKDFVAGDSLYGNMGWEFVKPRVTTVTIWIVDDAEMWIDDVRIYGINRDDVN